MKRGAVVLTPFPFTDLSGRLFDELGQRQRYALDL